MRFSSTSRMGGRNILFLKVDDNDNHINIDGSNPFYHCDLRKKWTLVVGGSADEGKQNQWCGSGRRLVHLSLGALWSNVETHIVVASLVRYWGTTFERLWERNLTNVTQSAPWSKLILDVNWELRTSSLPRQRFLVIFSSKPAIGRIS